MTTKNKKVFRSGPFVPEEEIEKAFAEHNKNFPAHLRKTALTLSYGEAKRIYLRGNFETWGKCFMVRLSKNYKGKEKLKK